LQQEPPGRHHEGTFRNRRRRSRRLTRGPNMARGAIVQTIGAVIDIEFPREDMPSIYDALLLAEGTENALVGNGLTFRVEQQVGDGVVRCISLGSSDGLRRG